MSMMFAALKRMESPAGPVRAAHQPARIRTATMHWLLPALCGGALVALAGWAWFGGRPAAEPPPPVAMPAIAAAPIPAPAPVVEPVAAPVVETVPVEPAPVEPVPVEAAPVVALAPADPAPVSTVPSGISVRDAREAAREPAAPEDQAIARHVAAIGTAIHRSDLESAQDEVDALAAILPPRSLTLLRMQAWVAHQRGDTASALSLYRDIVERVPGDQTAVINLAILEAANGQPASARERLQRLRQADGNSRAIENAIALVEASLR